MRQTKNPLEAYFRANQGRLIHKWSHYFDIYDRHLSSLASIFRAPSRTGVTP